MIQLWLTQLKPVLLTVTTTEVNMKVLAENLNLKTVYADYPNCQVQATQYAAGGLVIQLFAEDGERILTASVFIENWSDKLQPYQFYSKDWSENEGVVEWLKEQEIVTGTGRYVRAGFCDSELLELTKNYRAIVEARDDETAD